MTNALFDMAGDGTAPEDAVGRKKSRRSAPAAAPAAAAELPPALAVPEDRPVRVLGEVEGEPCSCGTTLWEVIEDHRTRWRVWCWACYRQRWMDPVPGVLPERCDFVIHEGRFSGLTLDEIVDEPRGVDVLRIYAKSHKSPAVQAAVAAFLDRRGIARYSTRPDTGGLR